MNIFAQRIGIYYVDVSWANYIAKTIVEECNDVLDKYVMNRYEKYIRLIDGTIIKFLPVNNENCRGQRFSLAFIQNKDLDKCKDFVQQIVYPMLTLGINPECYIIDEYEDLYHTHRLTSMREFYLRCEYGEDWRFLTALETAKSEYKYKSLRDA